MNASDSKDNLQQYVAFSKHWGLKKKKVSLWHDLFFLCIFHSIIINTLGSYWKDSCFLVVVSLVVCPLNGKGLPDRIAWFWLGSLPTPHPKIQLSLSFTTGVTKKEKHLIYSSRTIFLQHFLLSIFSGKMSWSFQGTSLLLNE